MASMTAFVFLAQCMLSSAAILRQKARVSAQHHGQNMSIAQVQDAQYTQKVWSASAMPLGAPRQAAWQHSDLSVLSQHIWSNTSALSSAHSEIVMQRPPRPVPQADKILFIMFAMVFGCCGLDRCFMGQFCLGFLKGSTLGGFFVWHSIDYCIAAFSAIARRKTIHVVGYHANFKSASIEGAFWLAALLLLFHIWCLYLQVKQLILQYREQEDLEARLAEESEVALQQATSAEADDASKPERNLQTPRHHQTYAFVPTEFMKALRKIGVVSEKPTIPELISTFHSMDKNGDGRICFDELKLALEAMGSDESHVADLLKTVDTDGDGNISKQEFMVGFARSADIVGPTTRAPSK